MRNDLEEIYHYSEISPELGTSGMPSRQQFALIARSGYQIVINLARDDSPGQLPDEASLVHALGMEYVHIPVEWEDPQVQDVLRFFEAMDACTGQKIFVHCVANYRAAVFVYLYRCTRLGVLQAQAWADMVRLWTPEGVWVELIQRIQDQSRS